MVRASDVDVTLAVERVPLLDGARETVALGIFSSLQPQNVRLRRAIRNLDAAARHPLYPLLFDPQTAGRTAGGGPGQRGGALRRRAARRRAMPMRAIIGFVSQRSAALEPVTLDLTGAALDAMLGAPFADTRSDPSPGEVALATGADAG